MTINAGSLDPGERLLWQDKPDVNAYCERKPLSGFWIGCGLVALAATITAFGFSENGLNSESQVIIGALLLFGAFLLYRPLLVRRAVRKTMYALTDRRAIIEVPGILLRNRVSVPFSEIRRIEVHDGIFGDVIFRDCVQQSEDGMQFSRDGFWAIANVQKVERLLRTEIAKANGQFSAGGSA
jgi:hypothetical protein